MSKGQNYKNISKEKMIIFKFLPTSRETNITKYFIYKSKSTSHYNKENNK